MIGFRLLVTSFAVAALVAVTLTSAATTTLNAQETRPSAASTAALLNLNQATAAELQKLPGIGAAMANRIIEYRQKSGGFKKVEDLMNVTGIGERNFLRLKPLVTVAPAKTAER